MENIRIENLTFLYPNSKQTILNDISMTIYQGDFITVCGVSGSGKTTFLRQLKPAIAPCGKKTGKIYLDNVLIEDLSQTQQANKIGFVMQSPENQIVTDKVWHELAFGLENLGLDQDVIRRKVAETSCFFGVEDWFEKDVAELSGGQKQILNLASVMIMNPSVLILDEPTSQLDPIATTEFLSFVAKINREYGTTVIITEHKLDEVFQFSNKIAVIDNGNLISFDTPQKTGENLRKCNNKLFLSLPTPMRVWFETKDKASNCPISVLQGKQWLSKYFEENKEYTLQINDTTNNNKNILTVKDVWFRYNKDSKDILKGIDFSVKKGEFISLLGGNGAGKSTLLSILSGVNKPYRGKINIGDKTLKPKVALLPQYPQSLFIKKTVKEDLYDVVKNTNLADAEKLKRINDVIGVCRLQNLIDRHPFDLSGGEQQRTALAKLLLINPDILLLDEPTKGLDNENKLNLANILNALVKDGKTIIMVTHDIDFSAENTDRCLLLFNGEIVSQGTVHEFFISNTFYLTSAQKLCNTIISKAITTDEIIYCCTGKKKEYNTFTNDCNPIISSLNEIKSTKYKKKLKKSKKIIASISFLILLIGIIFNLGYCNNLEIANNQLINIGLIILPVVLLLFCFSNKKEYNNIKYKRTKNKLSRRTKIATAFIMIIIPITIYIGFAFLQDKKYIFISLLIMIECMLPFFISFEGSKPTERELVLLAVLSAIAVASRIAFYMVPQFKPILALVIISAVAFGAESGFMVGAITMLVSNIFFMQGPWTPWQMFAMGIIGFLAGILSEKGLLSKSKISISIFGFFSAVLIYGTIMNTYSAIISNGTSNLQTFISFYIAGLPLDIVHGISTAIFLYFLTVPMLEKLERIKIKYGLINKDNFE